MTRKNLRKIVKITGLVIFVILITALTSCETNTAPTSKAHTGTETYTVHSFLNAADVHTSFSELWKLS